jgi:hypothetical protein
MPRFASHGVSSIPSSTVRITAFTDSIVASIVHRILVANDPYHHSYTRAVRKEGADSDATNGG